MSIDQHVSVTVTVNNAGIATVGFGTIGVLSYTDLFPERSRTYNRLADVIADGFAATSPEALAVGAILSQSPHPTQAKILRGTRKPTQRYLVEATDVVNAYAYEIGVKGEGVTATDVSYTSDSAATAAEVHNGLVTALNAVVGKNFTAAFAALVVADFVFTADNATETFTKVAHGLQTGDGPIQVSNAGGALPAGLAAATDYYVIRSSADTFQLATSLANALAGTAQPITTNGTGTQTLSDVAGTKRPASAFTVTGDAAGDWFAIAIANTSALSIEQNHADPGIATDLAEILVVDSDWFYLHTSFNSAAMVLAAAALVEATAFKAYLVDVVDSDSENVAAGGGDVLDQLLALGYKRTLYSYRRKPAEMFSAGLAGRIAALNPGKWTAAYKTIAGSTADAFSATQTTNLDAKKATYYKSEAGRSITWEGKVASAEFGFFDVTVALDFVVDLLQKRLFGVKVALNKVAYTDEDIALLARTAEGVLSLCKTDRYDIVAPGIPGSLTDPEPSVSFPRVRDIDGATRATRVIPDANISFRLQGAVHSTDIDLTVSF